MVRDLGKELYYVLNKIDPETEAIVLDSLPRDRVLASIPRDARVFRCGLDGSQLGFALEEVGRTADFLSRKAAAS